MTSANHPTPENQMCLCDTFQGTNIHCPLHGTEPYESHRTSKTKTPDEWSLEDARRYAAEARERGHNPEDQCNSGWLVPLDVEIERLTRGNEILRDELAKIDALHDSVESERDRLRAALEKLKDDAWECRGALRRFEMDVREHVRNSGMTQATRMQLSRAADKADAAEKVASQAIESVSTILRTALSGEPSAHETTASPQAPIARITVKADRCYAVELYAPGLPPGEHDLYCEPEAVAPMMREKRAYYETHDPPHCPTCDCVATAGDWLTNEQCDDVIAFLEDYEWTGLTRENVRTWCTAIAEARSSVKANECKPGFTQACSLFGDDPDAPGCCSYCGQPREAHPQKGPV